MHYAVYMALYKDCNNCTITGEVYQTLTSKTSKTVTTMDPYKVTIGQIYILFLHPCKLYLYMNPTPSFSLLRENDFQSDICCEPYSAVVVVVVVVLTCACLL